MVTSMAQPDPTKVVGRRVVAAIVDFLVLLVPTVLLFTVVVSIATGLLFGLAPLMHTRASGLLSALKEGGAKGAIEAVLQRF